MALSRFTPRSIPTGTLTKLIIFRSAHIAATPEPSRIQVSLADKAGYFKYERDWSRDKRYSAPQKLGDTPMRFLTRKLSHAYELYPIFILTGVWFIIFCYTIKYSFDKLEVWLDRSKIAPWDWERIRTTYYKKPTLLGDVNNLTRQRIPILEALQDEMVEAAKKRGTR